jgi:signal transduction histidine kinase
VNDFSSRVQYAFDRRQAVARAEATVTRGGTVRAIGLTTVPLLNERHEFLGMLGLFTDLTPLRELEHRVREMQNLADLGEISAGIAHEFRNSLSTIGGYLRLSHRGASRAESVAAVEKAEREANALARAVTSLLTYARPMEIETGPVDLLALAEAVVERIRVDSGVVIHCGGEQAIIDGDAALLDRAIENVIRNAVQSVQRKQNGGTVNVQVSAGRSASMVVTDEGVGVDPAEVATLFLPFRSTNPDGFGLGLPLAKKIVLLHGGTLRLTGQPGEGATAVMEFTPAMVAAGSVNAPS